MKQANNMDFLDYIEIVSRRWWLVILPFLLFATLSILYNRSLPDMYRAGTLILVQSQELPESYVRSTVTSSIDERLRTIGQQIMSRTMLEKIIVDLDLFKELRESLTMEEIVRIMRGNIEINVQGNDSFTLFYKGKEPYLVAEVTNRIAYLFIEENLKAREQHAEGTTEFLDTELKRIKQELELQESIIHTFKKKHMGALPSQMGANLSVLDRLQRQMQTNSAALSSLEDRKVLLQDSISAIEQEITGGGSSTYPELRLANLREALLNLKTKYTDEHPEVYRVKKEIRELEAKMQMVPEEIKPQSDESINPVAMSSPRYKDLANQLVKLNLEIKKIKREEWRLKKNIESYQQKVENTPKYEQELTIITRDYHNLKGNYQSLLNKKLEAQLSANMERKQKGEQFKIMDPARIPEKPFEPNRQQIILVGLLLGLGIGVGLAYMVEYTDHSFRDIKELEEFTKLPIIASIPKILTNKDMKRKTVKKRIVFASSLGALIMIIAVATIHILFSG